MYKDQKFSGKDRSAEYEVEAEGVQIDDLDNLLVYKFLESILVKR